jgi:hypothetical protein
VGRSELNEFVVMSVVTSEHGNERHTHVRSRDTAGQIDVFGVLGAPRRSVCEDHNDAQAEVTQTDINKSQWQNEK